MKKSGRSVLPMSSTTSSLLLRSSLSHLDLIKEEATHIPTFLCLLLNLMSASVMTGKILSGQTISSFAASPSSVEADLREIRDPPREANEGRRVRGEESSEEVELDLVEEARRTARGREEEEERLRKEEDVDVR